MEKNFIKEVETTDHFETAGWALQTWMHKVLNYTVRIDKNTKPIQSTLQLVNEQLSKLLNSLNSFEDYQSTLFAKSFLEPLSKVLAILPREALLKTQLTKLSLSRQIALAIIISKYPSEILSNATPESLQDAPKEVLECTYAAELLAKYFLKLLKLLLSTSSNESSSLKQKGFRRTISSFLFTLNYFIAKFQTWKAYDNKLMIQSFEDAFQQSYYHMVISKIAAIENPALANNAEHMQLIHTAESQVNKLHESLKKFFGEEKTATRLEEIAAAIQASIPNYARYFPSKETKVSFRSPSPTTLAKHVRASEESITKKLAQSSTTRVSLGDSPNKPVIVDEKKQESEREKAVTYTAAPVNTVTTATVHEKNSPTKTPLPAPSTTSIDPEKQKVKVYLDLLSKFIGGMENERLVHELTLDKTYRLPEIATTTNTNSNDPSEQSDGSTPSPTNDINGYLKKRMLAMMADQLVNSLRISNVTEPSQLQEGMIVPIKMPSMQSMPTSNPDHADDQITIHSVKIVKVYTSSTIPSSASNAETSDSSTAVEDEEKDEEKAWFVDAEFILDGHQMLGIPIAFVKNSTEKPSPTLFIHYLQDMLYQIADYLPHRPDLKQSLLTLLDTEIFYQLFKHYDSMNPWKDIYPILQKIYSFVLDLQAEYRVEVHQKWLSNYESLFQGLCSLGDVYTAGTAASSPESIEALQRLESHILYQTAKKKIIPLSPMASTASSSVAMNQSLERVLPLLPLFFEQITQCLEEFQRDMANYYISLLVPILDKHGHEILSSKFQFRLAHQQISLHGTTQWLLNAIQTASSPNTTTPTTMTTRWQQTLQDLVEAEVIPAPTTASSALMTHPQGLLNLSKAEYFQWSTYLVAVNMVHLLQYPIRLDVPPPRTTGTGAGPATHSAAAMQYYRMIPETFLFDLSRLAKLRDYIDTIALESALVITTRQLLASKFRVTAKEKEEIELSHRLDVLLSQSDVNFAFITSEILKYIEYVIDTRRKESVSSPHTPSSGGASSPHPRSTMASFTSSTSSTTTTPSTANTSSAVLSYDAKELATRVDQAVKELVSPGNSILALFTKRVYKILLRALLDKPYVPKLATYSLQHKAQDRNISQMVQLGNKLFQHTMKVHGELYQTILYTYLSSTAVTTAATTATASSSSSATA